MYCHVGIQSGKTCLAKPFSTNLRVSARKMVWNPNLELHPQGTQIRMCPCALLVKHAPLGPISLYTWGCMVGLIKHAVLNATLGTYPHVHLVNTPWGLFIVEPAIYIQVRRFGKREPTYSTRSISPMVVKHCK